MANSLRFITGIRYHKDMLERLNNMTYLFDPNWNINNSNKASFPVAFFHVKSYHEAMSSEVSQKQMLFYNSDEASNNADPSVDSGLLNVVADNIVIKPKVYKLDVIIPYHNLSLLDQSFVFNVHTLSAINAIMVGKEPKAGERMLQTYGTLLSPYTNFIKTLLRQMVHINFHASFEDWVRDTVQQPDFNKQSLELMWKLRHIVKMKMWNSWEYKYVAIVDIDISKEGTEDGVYEATLTVQEMPIVTMFNQASTRGNKFVYKNPFLEKNGEKIKALLEKAGGDFMKKEQ